MAYGRKKFYRRRYQPYGGYTIARTRPTSSSSSSSSMASSKTGYSTVQRRASWRKGLVGWGKSLSARPVQYHETVLSGSVTVTNGANSSYGSITFGLGQLAGVASMQTLFDVYRLTKVTVRFVPRSQLAAFTNAAPGSTSTPPLAGPGPLHVCLDPDDATAPTAESTVLQYADHRMVQLGQGMSWTFQPRPQVANAITTSAGSAIMVLSPWAWMDIAVENVLYFGMKWAISTGTNGYGFDVKLYDIYTDLYVELQCGR